MAESVAEADLEPSGRAGPSSLMSGGYAVTQWEPDH